MEAAPVATFKVHEYLRPKVCFTRSLPCAVSAVLASSDAILSFVNAMLGGCTGLPLY